MEPGDIAVWAVDLNLEEPGLASLGRTLSADEVDRARRFLRDSDRRRFTAARGMLRRLAANYLNLRPESIHFSYAAQGKPSIAEGGGLSFSLSHSGGRAIYAFAWNRALGIDLELLRPGVDVLGIAARFFSPAEAVGLERLAEEGRQREFFRLWTLKEAYIKALGEGLGAIGREPHADPRFRIEELALGIDECAALAYSGGRAKLRFFNDNDD